MLYLDTSALLKLYVREDGSREVQSTVSSQSEPLPVWEIQEMEFINALRLKVFWKELSEGESKEQIRLFEGRRARGLYFTPEIQRRSVMVRFRELSEKTIINGCRTMDVLHVACALEIGASSFVSFDERQNGLAKECGLRVR